MACSCLLLFPNVARRVYYLLDEGFLKCFYHSIHIPERSRVQFTACCLCLQSRPFSAFNSYSYRWQTIIILTPIKTVLLQVLFRIFGLNLLLYPFSCCIIVVPFPTLSPLKSAGSSVVVLLVHWLMFHDFNTDVFFVLFCSLVPHPRRISGLFIQLADFSPKHFHVFFVLLNLQHIFFMFAFLFFV